MIRKIITNSKGDILKTLHILLSNESFFTRKIGHKTKSKTDFDSFLLQIVQKDMYEPIQHSRTIHLRKDGCQKRDMKVPKVAWAPPKQ